MTNFNKNLNLSDEVKQLPIREKLKISYKKITILGVISLVIGMLVLIITNFEYKNAIETYGNSQSMIGKLGMEFNNQQSLLRELLISDGSVQANANKELLKSTQNSADALTEVGKK